MDPVLTCIDAHGLTKSDAEALDYLRTTLREGRYQLSDEEATMEMKAKEKERRLEKGAIRKKAANENSLRPPGGPRDFWLPSDTKHYLGKVAKNAIIDQEILRIRVHQTPRSQMLSWGEANGIPAQRACDQRLTIMREHLLGNEGDNPKYGPMRLIWDRWGKSEEVKSARPWIGATVILKDSS